MILLFIHGAGCTGLAFREQSAAFAGARTATLPGRPSAAAGPESIVEFAEFIERYVSLNRIADVVLCGHSMGGAVAIEQALRQPGWLRGIVLVSSGARLRVAPWIFDGIASGLELFAQEFVPEYYFADPQPEWVDSAVTDMVAGVGPEQTLRDFRACDAFDALERLAEISVPLLALTGENDKMTPAKYATAIADRVPRAEARIIPGAGHFVMVERAEETNAAIRSFLSRIV